MPTYNACKTIMDAVNSVIKQDYINWELIIVDDNSSDNTSALIKEVNDPRVKYFRLQSNSGSPASPRNKALELSSGFYIAFLDSDDIWYPTKLSKQIYLMDENEIDFSCTTYDISKERNCHTTYHPPTFASYKDLLLNNSVGCLTAVCTRSVLRGLHFPHCGHEDYALWLKVIKRTNGVYSIDEALACYQVVDGSVSSNKYKLFPFFWNIYRHEENMSFLASLFYCIRYFVNVIWFKYK